MLGTIGIKNAVVVGDTRFDRVLQIKEASKQLPLVEAFVSNAEHVFCAGSSWQPDEEIFIPYFNGRSDWKLIIAPHVIGEEHLAQIMQLLKGRRVTRYTQTNPEEAAKADVLIIDCFGLLSSIYRYAQVSYVGGGFGAGIHNTLEAGVWGIPVIFGPNNKRFAEAQGLLKCKGGFEIKDVNDFTTLMVHLESEPALLEKSGKAAADYVKSLSGATEKILKGSGLA